MTMPPAPPKRTLHRILVVVSAVGAIEAAGVVLNAFLPWWLVYLPLAGLGVGVAAIAEEVW